MNRVIVMLVIHCFRFGIAPLDSFHSHLSSGHFRPDIRRMRRLVRKAQQRRLLFEERKRTYELADQLFKSRESLLLNAYKQGFSQPTSHRAMSKLHWRKPTPAMVEEKTQMRYVEELNTLRAELGITRFADTTSENDENYPQYQTPGTKQKKKRKGTMGMQPTQMRTNSLNHEDEDIRPVFSTLQREVYTPNPSFLIREMTEDSYRTMLSAHKGRRTRLDIHPELNTQGISLADLTQRAQIGQKHKLTMGNSLRITPAKKRIKLEQPQCTPVTPKISPLSSIKHEHDNNDYLHMAEDIKHGQEVEIESQTCQEMRSTTFSPVKNEPIDNIDIQSTLLKKKINPVTPKSVRLPVQLPPPPPPPPLEIKKENEEIDYTEPEEKSEYILPTDQTCVESDEEVELDVKKELDLENIDMMQIPIQLDDGIDILGEDDSVIAIPEKDVIINDIDDLRINGNGDLMQETHASFFSLLRDAFLTKGEYRMSHTEVKDAVTLWQGNPISPLNDWYSLATSWSALVPSALGFLAGELTYVPEHDQHPEHDVEFVPYLENKNHGIYAWIGAGRDSDSRLMMLCMRFLQHRDILNPPQSIPAICDSSPSTVPVKNTSVQISCGNGNTSNGIVTGNVRSASPAVESINCDASSSISVECEPPQALCPTEWKVRLSTPEEREEFRRQERLRYASPHKAFTYRMHGYSSVVGPVKGIYQHNPGAGLTKPRGHSLLVADRPNFVTILALVRDATARLPNGEGTRSDICMLLKDSQYIKEQSPGEGSNEKDNYLNSVVSGALDRLHYETDPCVRYYPRRKEWLYLHRARSESEFEMYHQQLQGVTKTKKNPGSASRNKSLQSNIKLVNGKDQATGVATKEITPKKERKVMVQTQPIIKKEIRIVEEKINVEQPIFTEIQSSNVVTTNPTMSSVASSMPVTISASTSPMFTTLPSPQTPIIERETVAPVEAKVQHISAPISTLKKIGGAAVGKPVAVVKTNATQSLLQSNQHFPHHQIQVSTSAGLQTIRLSGHSVLQSAQSTANAIVSSASTSTPNVPTIFPSAKIQNQTQQTVLTNQTGKSLLQNTNIKQQLQQQQQQQQHVLPGKTLLASQIKLVSSGQIKSLLTGHGLQGQTIFIKQSSPSATQHVQQLKVHSQHNLFFDNIYNSILFLSS